MKVGEMVRFSEVKEPGDESCVFVVEELRGDRVLVTEVAVSKGMTILPQFVYLTSELVSA